METGKVLDRYKFEQLFKELYPQLLRYCTQFIRNQTIAEDIVQEKFIQLWEKRDTLQINTSYKSYLFAAVRNKCIDIIRSRYAHSFITIDEKTNCTAEDANSYQTIEYKEFSDAVTQAVENLPDKCYTVFSMHRYGNLKRKEIAKELNISERTVDNHLAYALKKIKMFLLKCDFLKLLIF